jgi:hypothetical protein
MRPGDPQAMKQIDMWIESDSIYDSHSYEADSGSAGLEIPRPPSINSIVSLRRSQEPGMEINLTIPWARWIQNGVFWVVTPCGSGKNRRFGRTWRLLHQGDKNGALGTTEAATSNRRTLRRFLRTDFCHPDEGGARFLRNVSSYKSHTA